MSVEFISLADFKLRFLDKSLNELVEQAQLDQASNHLCDIARGFEVEESEIALPLDNIAMDYLQYRTYFIVALQNANNSPDRAPARSSFASPQNDQQDYHMRTYERLMNNQAQKLNAKIFRGEAEHSVEFTSVRPLFNG